MNQQLSYQFAIIGGGLAGLTLAIQLRKKGCSVIVFEKESYPFHRVCGEYISMESWRFLEQLGVPLSTLNLPKITNLTISSPSGFTLSRKLDLGGFGISRYLLDNILYSLAIENGVIVNQNCTVLDVQQQLITTTMGNYTASIILGSWGKRSKMDAVLVRDFLQPHNRKLSNYVGVKYHVKADLSNNVIELHNFKNGYCGISKIEDDRYCMCYLVSGSELKKAGGNIKKLEETVLMKNPFLKKYFTQFPSLFEKPLTISQISFESKSMTEGNILMLGDAAGLITPLCGNGMSMALHSSSLIAQQLIKHIDGQQTFSEVTYNYQQNWNFHFAKRLKMGRFIQSLFGNSNLTDLTIGLLKPFPFLTDALIKQTHGKPF